MRIFTSSYHHIFAALLPNSRQRIIYSPYRKFSVTIPESSPIFSARRHKLFSRDLYVRTMDELSFYPSGSLIVLSESETSSKKDRNRKVEASEKCENSTHQESVGTPQAAVKEQAVESTSGVVKYRLLMRYESQSSVPKILTFLRQKDDSWTSTLGRIRTKLQRKQRKVGKGNEPTVSSEEINAEDEIPVEIIWNSHKKNEKLGKKDEDLKIADIFGNQEARALKLKDDVYEISYDPPHIEALQICLTPVAECPLMVKLDLKNAETKEIELLWFVQLQTHGETGKPQIHVETQGDSAPKISVDGYEYRSSGLVFVPAIFDSGKKICVVCNPGPHSIIRATYTAKTAVEALNEEFLWTARREFMKTVNKSDDEIRVMSYNILADLYLDLKLEQESLWFPYCPKEFQSAEYRYPLLLNEILGYEADIFCLQEVDLRFFSRYLKPLSETKGYGGVMAIKGGEVNEGLCTFFDQEKFRLAGASGTLVSDLLANGDSENEHVLRTAEQNPDVFQMIKSRPTVLQVAVLESKKSSKVLILANTHLFYHPAHPHVRLIQMSLCLNHISSVLQEFAEASKEAAVIFCGDLNSTPKTGVYHFLTNSRLDSSHSDWSSGNSESFTNFQGADLHTNLKLTNACGSDSYTNYTMHSNEAGFMGCLDYIWIDSNRFMVKRVIPMPDHDLVTKYEAIPSKICPSDHLPIICDIAYKT